MEQKERKECPDCHRTFKKLQLCKDKKRRCTRCMRWKVSNKWYIPPEKLRQQNQGITRFTMTGREKDMLHAQFMQQGLDSYLAWKKVNRHASILRNMRRIHNMRNTMRIKRQIQEKESKEINRKKFFEGLK